MSSVPGGVTPRAVDRPPAADGLATANAGWLVEQLPRPLAHDEFVPRFLRVFEEVADTVRDRVDGVEHHLDVRLAPPAFVRWMGGWLGLALDPSLPADRLREVVRAVGPLLGWRGTRRGLEGLLAALTGGAVQIRDGGGVYTAGQARASDHHIAITLERSGGLEEHQLLELVEAEVPADATVELVVGTHAVEAAPPEDPDAGEADSSDAAPEPLSGEGYLPPMVGGSPQEPDTED